MIYNNYLPGFRLQLLVLMFFAASFGTTVYADNDSDCGDAPVSYGACCANVTGNNIFLGWCRDAESGHQPSLDADGDDLNNTGTCQYGSDDEDGTQFYSDLIAGAQAILDVASPYDGGELFVYLDVNQDGDFLDAGEMVLTESLFAGDQVPLLFVIPENTVPGETYMRSILLPLGYQGEVGPIGQYSGGEVEDEKVTVKPEIFFEKRPLYKQNYQGHAGFFFIIRNDWQESISNVNFTDNLENVLPGLTPDEIFKNNCPSSTIIWDPPFLKFSKASFNPGEYCDFTVTLNIPEGVEKGNYPNVTSLLWSGYDNIAAPASTHFMITHPINQGLISIGILLLGEDFFENP